MKTKKIVFSNYDSIGNPYYSGGGARSIYQVASALKNDYEVTVVSGKYPNSKNEYIDGVNYVYIGSSLVGPQIGQIVFSILLPIWSLFKDFDVWFDSLTPPFSASVLPILFGKKVVGLVHMLSGKDMVRKYYLPFDIVEKIGLKFYQKFITTTHEVSNQISNINKKAEIFVIPNAVKKYDNSTNKREHILYIGRIEINQKGLDLLIESYKKIDIVKPPLLIAGSGSKHELKKLTTLIGKDKDSKNISFIGQVEGDAKKRVIQNASCIVVPSRFETFSVVCLESLANGIPLVTFNLENLCWIPKEARYIAKEIDSDSLMHEIIESTKQSQETVNKIHNGYKVAEQYSEKKIHDMYRKITETI